MNFNAVVDLPLLAAILVGFLMNFHYWAHDPSVDADLELKMRLPAARVRITVLLAGLAVASWLANVTVGGLLLLAFAGLSVGFVIALVLTGTGGLGGEILVFVSAGLLREWAFGFPSFRRSIPEFSATAVRDERSKLVGRDAIADSPLRPSGEVRIDGQKLPARSDSGKQIDAGTAVIVVAIRNGYLCVMPTTSVDQSLKRDSRTDSMDRSKDSKETRRG